MKLLHVALALPLLLLLLAPPEAQGCPDCPESLRCTEPYWLYHGKNEYCGGGCCSNVYCDLSNNNCQNCASCPSQ